MNPIPKRSIKRLLVANRGEIATRIISTARELEIETYALYTSGDDSHILGASHSLELSSPSAYLSIPQLLQIVQTHKIDAIHPGYGFLSEDWMFSKTMWEEGNAIVIGPGWEVLSRTGDKLRARKLAEDCNVPVLSALQTPTSKKDVLDNFAREAGYLIIIKAVDGGGGRGIRIVRSQNELLSLAARALSESPSGMVFAEKAAVDGFRHVEVQIIGDGSGAVRHLWERECSIQRRFQKVVEFAPSSIRNRDFLAVIIEAALIMARAVKYCSLGTFEFLASPSTSEFYFLEINPRIQVEHTITESICMGVDLVKLQLQISQGVPLSELSIAGLPDDPRIPPSLYSIQLRLTAENPDANWSLGVGKITSHQFPNGNGIRIDTHLRYSSTTIVGTEFDSLLAKLIITAPSWPEVVAKSKRALTDTRIKGVKTNLDALRGIVSSTDFTNQNCDTQWLERNSSSILDHGRAISSKLPDSLGSSLKTSTISAPSNILLRKGDAWNISLKSKESSNAQNHHLEVTQIQQSEFPASINASIIYTAGIEMPVPYQISVSATKTSASTHSNTLTHRKGDFSNPLHINSPFPGRLMEVIVDKGDLVKRGDTVAVVRQMKMEVDIRAAMAGKVNWIFEMEDEVDIGEGDLIVMLKGISENDSKL